MGAKLVAPLLLKSFEKLFDSPIKVLQSSFALEQSPASWIDIVTFARTNSSEFALIDIAPGVKTCRFWLRGGQIEISEDDYRLIVSGAPERMIPTQPIPEDETAELATLNILEGRLAMLIKKADAVASRARQLNYHLKGRKTAFMARKSAEQQVESVDRTLSPQSIASRSPAPVGNGDVGKIQQSLLEQFLVSPPQATSRRASIALARPKSAKAPTALDIPPQQTLNLTPNNMTTYNFSQNTLPTEPNDRRPSQTNTATSSDDGLENHYRVVMATKIDKLAKGDVIFPPCDRCRRLKFDCIKHISACAGCTKKHARCSWKDIREGELEYTVPAQMQHRTALPQLQENGAYLPVDVVSGRTVDGGVSSPMSGRSARMTPEEEKMYKEHTESGRVERNFVQSLAGHIHASAGHSPGHAAPL
jgi:hypothetical protein